MEFHAHVFTTHQAGKDDGSPLHLVSAEQVAYWKQIEVDYIALMVKLAEVVEPVPPPNDGPGRRGATIARWMKKTLLRKATSPPSPR